ncbi:hypothetical protein [Paenibacillus lutrae]|uniref:Uncharacterized protein n=1 Tax=Paenibacillus lutrae TaxID=2078573 RepID=A0A7X3JZT6_9BACL|nr:hypothetical protein [Paenibacillus lutrae]MVP00385.1 hypothetical protein [Paenibacillus lutrae]
MFRTVEEIIEHYTKKEHEEEMNTAIVSAHMYLTGVGSCMEVLNIIHDDFNGTGIFDDLESALLEQIEPDYEYSESYFFIAIVKAEFVEHRNWEGSEYEVEYDVTEIKNISQISLIEEYYTQKEHGDNGHVPLVSESKTPQQDAEPESSD